MLKLKQVKLNVLGMHIPETGQTYIPDPNDPLINGTPLTPDEKLSLTAQAAQQLEQDYLTDDMKWKTEDIIKKASQEISFNVKYSLGPIEVSTLGYNHQEIKNHFEALGYKLTRIDKRNEHPRYKVEW